MRWAVEASAGRPVAPLHAVKLVAWLTVELLHLVRIGGRWSVVAELQHQAALLAWPAVALRHLVEPVAWLTVELLHLVRIGGRRSVVGGC